MKLLLPSLETSADTSNDIMPYEAYFHSLLQSSGASRLELVRDDAIGTDPSEVARLFLASTAPPKVDFGLPSLPRRKLSADNLSHLLNQSTNSDASDAHGIRDHHECASPSSSRRRLRTQRGQDMNKSLPWSSERASRKSLRSSLEDTTPEQSDTFPQSSSRERSLPYRSHANKRQHCRWSASSVPTAVGSG